MIEQFYPWYWKLYDMAEDEGNGYDSEDDPDSGDPVEEEPDPDIPPSDTTPIGGSTGTTEGETGETTTVVTYGPTGEPIYTRTLSKTPPKGGLFKIKGIRGNFDNLQIEKETREYVVTGDVGSTFKLKITSSDGCTVFDEVCEITSLKGFTAVVDFLKVYEYTKYTFELDIQGVTILNIPGLKSRIKYTREIEQYINPTITLSYATDDPYGANVSYSGNDVTFAAKSFAEPSAHHTLANKTYGKLTHAVTPTITTGYLYIKKTPGIGDYILLDNRQGLSATDLDKTLKLGSDETLKTGTIAVTENSNKKSITLTSTVQIEKIGKEDTTYELDIDSIITNIPQAFHQEVETEKETAIIIDVLKNINIKTYLTPSIIVSPKHGTLVTSSFGAGVGTCTYTPPTLFQGIDDFDFVVTDGTNTSEDHYTVTIKVGNAACG
tara:strand:+ start:241 stop:1548 length:1308 start_codon:yes stop_codon:yes gene_type:complete